MLENYFPILIFIFVGLAIGVVPLTLGWLISLRLGTHKPDSAKLSPYECGFEAFEDAPLVKSVQEQQKEIEDLQAAIQKRDQQINVLEASVKNLKTENSEIAFMKEELEKIKKILGMEANSKIKIKQK